MDEITRDEFFSGKVVAEMEGERLLELCRVMLRRLVRCILDFDCFSVLAQ